MFHNRAPHQQHGVHIDNSISIRLPKVIITIHFFINLSTKLTYEIIPAMECVSLKVFVHGDLILLFGDSNLQRSKRRGPFGVSETTLQSSGATRIANMNRMTFSNLTSLVGPTRASSDGRGACTFAPTSSFR